MIEQILEADRNLQVDQVDKARDIYARVVELDPGNAIAVVGLAQCALAEGDDEKAHHLASRALEVDPENDMARRMEARLSEILATRGEPVERPPAAATPSPQEMRPVVTDDAPTDPTPAPAAVDALTPEPQAPTPIPKPTPTPTPTKEPAVRKSLFDRLLGR
ncbi:MAG: tetratricopeptide repeat protein [Chloroflexota bacterium]|nr:tetratricopeptide repeat protein [Chloroflexota bacterium]